MKHAKQVAWYETHLFKERVTDTVGERPAAGTPDWCSLDDDDPRKAAALLDAGVLWCLRIDTEQEQRAEASRHISEAADWTALAARTQQHAVFYRQRPWLKRRAS